MGEPWVHPRELALRDRAGEDCAHDAPASVRLRMLLIDTSVVIDLGQVYPDGLPSEVGISAVTLAELAAGPHATSDPDDRARRQERLQRTEATFESLPVDSDVARAYGRIYGAVAAAGRSERQDPQNKGDRHGTQLACPERARRVEGRPHHPLWATIGYWSTRLPREATSGKVFHWIGCPRVCAAHHSRFPA